LKKTNLKGELSVTFNKISGFLNPNALRLQSKKDADNGMGIGAMTNNNSDKNPAADKKQNNTSLSYYRTKTD